MDIDASMDYQEDGNDKETDKTESCKQLLDTFYANPRITKVEKLVFSGVGNRDVYNITAPFQYDGEEVILGRVEERDSEFSQVFFFTCKNQVWSPRVHTHTYNLQDPCVTIIKGELIVGGVEVITAVENPSKIVSWVTQFYRGFQIDSLCHFSSGPGTMKDIRLIELNGWQNRRLYEAARSKRRKRANRIYDYRFAGGTAMSKPSSMRKSFSINLSPKSGAVRTKHIYWGMAMLAFWGI